MVLAGASLLKELYPCGCYIAGSLQTGDMVVRPLKDEPEAFVPTTQYKYSIDNTVFKPV